MFDILNSNSCDGDHNFEETEYGDRRKNAYRAGIKTLEKDNEMVWIETKLVKKKCKDCGFRSSKYKETGKEYVIQVDEVRENE